MPISSEKLQARREVELFFRQTAAKENQQNQKIDFSEFLLKNDKKNFLLVCKNSGGDILNASSLLESLRKSYPSNEWNIYFACEPRFHDLLNGCPFIDKVLPFQEFMMSEIACIGAGENKGLFHGYNLLTADTQLHLSYLSNHNISLNLT